MTLSISLSPQAQAKLMQKATNAGQTLDVYASRLLDDAASKPTVDEVLAPFRKQVEDSGMTDAALDAFFEDVREKAFQERQRRAT